MTEDQSSLYAVLACVLVLAGSLIAIPFARRTMRVAATAVAPTIDIEPWALSLGLEYEAPGRNERFPKGRLHGTVGGYAVQVFESAAADMDGDVYEQLINVQVSKKSASKWPSALDERGRTKLVEAHPHLGTLLADVNGTRGAVIGLGRVVCSIPIPAEPDPGLPARVDATLHRAVELARALDVTFADQR